MSFSESYFKTKNIRTVVHVGADRGGELPQYREMGVKKVVWIEANPEVYQELQENLQIMNIADVESLPFNHLISDCDDLETDFHIYYGSDAGHLVGNKGMSSMLRAKNTSWMTQCYRGTARLKSLTLDTFLERNHLGTQFDLLTMDTQGAELMILKGAHKLLDHVRYVNSEVTLFDPFYDNNTMFEELRDYLARFGFEHVQTQLDAHNWGDAIFQKKNGILI